MVGFSEDPLTYATETCIMAFNNATKNKVVARGVTIQPAEDEEETTLDHIRDLMAHNPNNPIIATKAVEALKNVVVNKPSEEVRDNKPEIDKILKDIKKIAQIYPILPALDDCTEEIDSRIDTAQGELKEAPVLLAGPASYQPKKGDLVNDPMANATPSDMQDLGFLSDQVDRLNEIAKLQPLTPKEVNDLEKTCDAIKTLVHTDPEVEERSCWNLEIPKKLSELAVNPNIPPSCQVETMDTIQEVTKTPEVQ